ncbi:MAG: hypothetical protein ACRC6I_00905, partial [Paracoccaceae bacterium]
MTKFLVCLLGSLGFATAAAACPDYNQSGQGGYFTGADLRRGVAYEVTAGGDSYIWNCPGINPETDTGAGYFPTPPDFTFSLEG